MSRFRHLGAVMLRALERRRDRAFDRAAGLNPQDFGRPLTGSELIERTRWEEMHRYYAGAYDNVHGAMVFVHYAWCRLREIRDDAKRR